MSNVCLDSTTQITYFPYSTLSSIKGSGSQFVNSFNKETVMPDPLSLVTQSVKKAMKNTIFEHIFVLFTAPVK
ncbi:MAG: hypothetical protein A3D24_00380 [Candidatus Blackburnbacteria bacterium RIFCSPHIGHO2_02_FULL_39_13]|nr:MAG: hypothetical protein A3D24_00380 [Candidatus Blackburnbacteria bacterium RIFCSPHIGHO2_02_FULL_39_13]OGY14581.1 MAG: hypothetical protein A3I52_00335 [Candidatus Blackburnbacteria bacterium RIFCSPLOWO2_02_FULL_40_10]HBL52069.1 hypothetical protein [Candidatus Blackburnbacteria bacterium]